MRKTQVVNHVIPNLVIGGAQTALRNLISNLPQYDHSVWSFDNQIGEEWEGFSVQSISLMQLLKTIRSEDDSIYHFHWYPPFKFQIPSKIKSVVTIQDNFPCTVFGGNFYVVSTSEGLDYIPSNCVDLSVIIPPAIDIRKWKRLQTTRKKGVLIRHSTIYPAKLNPSMIDDMSLYSTDRYVWKVIGVGNKNYIDTLKTHCKHSTIAITSSDDIALELNEAWLYVYHAPEGYEHFGLCFMEALACGIPIITNDIKGGKAQIRNGFNGFVCSNYVEMRDMVEYLYENPEIYEKLIKNITTQSFAESQTAYADSYAALYEKLKSC